MSPNRTIIAVRAGAPTVPAITVRGVGKGITTQAADAGSAMPRPLSPHPVAPLGLPASATVSISVSGATASAVLPATTNLTPAAGFTLGQIQARIPGSIVLSNPVPPG